MSQTEQDDTPREPDFWDEISIPLNEGWKENGHDMVNPVVVQEQFATATNLAAQAHREAEILTGAIANWEYEKKEKEYDLWKIRRSIITDNFGSYKASYGSEALDAFVLANAGAHRDTLLALGEEIEAIRRKIARQKPRLERLHTRLSALEANMNFSKQFLDYDKKLIEVNRLRR